MSTSTDGTQTKMLKLVRYATRTADVATVKRDAAIREAHRAGASLRDIAGETGLSHMTIKRIIERAAQ
jgi:hypothetical protein